MRTHQVLHFKDGSKATFWNVEGVKENEFIQLKLADSRKILINKANVNWVEIMDDDFAKKTFGKMYMVYSANEDNLK